MNPENTDKVKAQLGPSAWIDQNNNLHLDIKEALKEAGIPDTPGNRAAATKLFMSLVSLYYPETQIIARMDPSECS